jgi:hypothetical protein
MVCVIKWSSKGTIFYHASNLFKLYLFAIQTGAIIKKEPYPSVMRVAQQYGDQVVQFLLLQLKER